MRAGNRLFIQRNMRRQIAINRRRNNKTLGVEQKLWVCEILPTVSFVNLITKLQGN